MIPEIENLVLELVLESGYIKEARNTPPNIERKLKMIRERMAMRYGMPEKKNETAV
jgi:hypothetical protein